MIEILFEPAHNYLGPNDYPGWACLHQPKVFKLYFFN